MKHFIDKINSMSKQSVSAAVVMHGDKEAGKILVRWTDSQIGWNVELSAAMYGENEVGFKTTTKGNTYSNVMTLVNHFKQFGIVPLDWGKKPMDESHSQITDCRYLKEGRKTFKVLWAI